MTASSISSIPADYEAETVALPTDYCTAQQSVTESVEKQQVVKNLVNAIVAALRPAISKRKQKTIK